MKYSVVFAGSNTFVLEYLAQRKDIDILCCLFHKKSGDPTRFIASCVKHSIAYSIIGGDKQMLALGKNIDRPDLGICAGFEILPKDVCNWPKKGFINIHPSYLPYYKGANPYYHMLKNNEKKGGVSIHEVTKDIDGGRIFCQSRYPIFFKDDISVLIEKADQLSKKLLDKYLIHILKGDVRGIRNSRGSYYPPVRTRQWIDSTMSALEIYNIVRSQTIYGGCYFNIEKKIFVVRKADLIINKGTGKSRPHRKRITSNQCVVKKGAMQVVLNLEPQ